MRTPSTRSASTVGSSHRVVRFTSPSLAALARVQRPGADDLVARAGLQAAVDQVDLAGYPAGPLEPAQRVHQRAHVHWDAASGQGQVRLVTALAAHRRT